MLAILCNIQKRFVAFVRRCTVYLSNICACFIEITIKMMIPISKYRLIGLICLFECFCMSNSTYSFSIVHYIHCEFLMSSSSTRVNLKNSEFSSSLYRIKKFVCHCETKVFIIVTTIRFNLELKLIKRWWIFFVLENGFI